MKIVAINGSPRKDGNTAKLIHEITKDHAGVDLKHFDLGELKIADCKACMYCKTHEACSIKDDMNKIYSALMDADAVVLGTPLYMSSETATVKAFEDRMYAMLAFGEQRGTYAPRLPRGKKAFIVITCGNPKGKEMYASTGDRLLGFFAFQGFNPVEVEFQGGLAATMNVLEMPNAQAIIEKGRKFLSGECD